MEIKLNQHYLSQVLNLYQQKLASFTINDNLRTIFIDELDATVDHLAYYIVCSPSALNEIVKKASSIQDEAFLASTLEVFNYLVYPDDILPDNKRGIYGYLDDAWLIHNFITYSIHAKYLEKEEVSLDWNVINHINSRVERAVSPDNYTLLNQRLGRVLKDI